MKQPVPVILTGFGRWVRTRTVVPLMKQYSEMLRIVAITSLKEGEFEESVKPEFEEYGWQLPQMFADLEEACRLGHHFEEKPKAVLVTTPNAFHYQEAKIAIEQGYHVYVERPIVTSKDDLPALVELAETHDRLLFTGPQRRLEAPFQYLYGAVTKNYDFDHPKRIRCHVSTGWPLRGWRRNPTIAGGGVVTHNGHHLLDIVAWLLDGVGVEIPERLRGSVHFRFDELCSEGISHIEVETEAVGYVELPDNILLSFDFTCNAPKNSIYEQIELSDQNYARIQLTRDQAVRTPLPATITHQKPDGKFVEIETRAGQGIRADAVRFSGEAQNMEPLRMFLKGVNGDLRGTQAIQARTSISTWHLVREIYRLGEQDSAA